MRNIIGIVNLHDGPHLGKLTEKNPLGNVTFLGRYSFMDFTLSNFSNSEINKLYILCEANSTRIRNHVQSGSLWITNTKTGFAKILINEKTLSAPKFNTDIYNINVNMAPLESLDCDYIVVAPPFFVNCMDYRKLVEKHVASKADITLAYTHVSNADVEWINCDSLKLNKKTGYVSKFLSNSGGEKEADISLETFVFSKKVFIELCSITKSISQLYTLRRMVRYGLDNKLWKIGTYEYKGYTVPMLSLKNYINYSFQLLDYDKRSKLFDPNWPIYTTTHNTPPALYYDNAQVSNSFIANGSIIKGKVVNSIIGREAIVKEGAVVKNCIVNAQAVIGEDSNLEYVLVDKAAEIREVKKLSGDRNEILFIKEGAKI